MDEATRIEEERRFHDERFSSDEQRSSGRLYAITGTSAARYRELIEGIVAPGSVLEIGCGDHAEIWALAERGLDVTAIDISSVAVDAARERAAAEGLDNVRVEVMNAEELTFDNDSFDAVVGAGILHHLDLDKGVPEVARVLRPGGVAVFLEPLGHNPLLNLYRRVTPSERTPDEHPLLRSDLRFMERWFEETDFDFFHLASMASLPLMSTSYFDRALAALDKVDGRLLRTSRLAQDLAWFVTIELRSPKQLKVAATT